MTMHVNRRIEKFLTKSGKEYEYDSESVVIKHDRDTGEFSWWACGFRGDPGEQLLPVYKSILKK